MAWDGRGSGFDADLDASSGAPVGSEWEQDGRGGLAMTDQARSSMALTEWAVVTGLKFCSRTVIRGAVLVIRKADLVIRGEYAGEMVRYECSRAHRDDTFRLIVSC